MLAGNRLDHEYSFWIITLNLYVPRLFAPVFRKREQWILTGAISNVDAIRRDQASCD
jgi:hypothetical protein